MNISNIDINHWEWEHDYTNHNYIELVYIIVCIIVITIIHYDEKFISIIRRYLNGIITTII